LAAPSGVLAQFPTEAALDAFIRANMPGNAPGTLTGEQAGEVTDYIWHIAH
jgi:hypothetical protein